MSSQDPIGVDGGIILYGYVHDPNFWVDVLGLERLPRSNGSWSREERNSTWYSDNKGAKSITKNKGVEFKNGYPDFSHYSKGTYNFNNLDGTDKDFAKEYERIKKEKN